MKTRAVGPPAEVLRLVNEARVALGQKPLKRLPKGERGDVSYCPLAIALHTWIGAENASVESDREAERLAEVWGTEKLCDGEVWLPRVLREFVLDFDAGKYPDLVNGKCPDLVKKEKGR